MEIELQLDETSGDKINDKIEKHGFYTYLIISTV